MRGNIFSERLDVVERYTIHTQLKKKMHRYVTPQTLKQDIDNARTIRGEASLAAFWEHSLLRELKSLTPVFSTWPPVLAPRSDEYCRKNFQMDLLFSAAACSDVLMRAVAEAIGLLPATLEPGWLNVRSTWGKTVIHIAVEWGCVSSFTYLLKDLRDRTPVSLEWQRALDAHVLLRSACSVEHRRLFWGHPEDEKVYEVDCCKIAIQLASELDPAGFDVTCIYQAARNGFVDVLQIIKARLEPETWASLVAVVSGDDLQDTALSAAAVCGRKDTVLWLLANAKWSSVAIAAAINKSTEQNDIFVHLVAVLVERHRQQKLDDPVISRLLSTALSTKLFGHLHPENVAVLNMLVQDLDTELLVTGPESVFMDEFLFESFDRVAYVLEYIKTRGLGLALGTLIDDFGITAFMEAARTIERPEVIQLGIDAICALDPADQMLIICAKDKAGDSAAMHAARELRLETLERFETHFPSGSVDSEAYVHLATVRVSDCTYDLYDWSPFVEAVRQGLPRVVANLLRAGADPLETFPCKHDGFKYASALEVLMSMSTSMSMSMSIDSDTTNMFRQLIAASKFENDESGEAVLRKCLLRACKRGSDVLVAAVLEALYDRGYDCSGDKVVCINDDDDDEEEGVMPMSPLQAAELGGHASCIAVLNKFAWVLIDE